MLELAELPENFRNRFFGGGCLNVLGVPAEIGHSEDCVPLPYGRGSECWY